jgi:predicted permease
MSRRVDARRQIDRELETHVAMLVEELMRQGMDEPAARREAARRFGQFAPIADECETIHERRVRRASWRQGLAAFAGDLRQAARVVIKTPALTFVIATTLMLGIGATTAIYSVVDQVLLRPLDYPTPERLVAISDEQGGESPTPLSFSEFTALRTDAGQTFDEIGAFFSSGLTLTNAGEPRVLRGVRLSAGIPRLLGVQPILGRLLTDADDRIGGDRTIMLSEQCWKDVFGADPKVVGRTLTLEGLPFTVVGIYPSDPSTRLPNELASDRQSDYWQPLRLDATNAPSDLHFMSAIGRLRPGVDISQARTRLTAIDARLKAVAGTTHHAALESLSDRVLGPVRRLLVVFLLAVGLVLAIACANVAGLLLAHGAVRERELAARSAIGATGRRVASQLLAESSLRALIGGVLGAGLAYVVVGVLRQSTSTHLPRLADVHVDARILAFTFGLSIVTGLLCGLVPALRATRVDLAHVLRDGGRGATTGLGHDRFRRSLVATEIALSFALLVGTALLLRSFQQLMATNKGFDSDRLVSASLSLPYSRYPDASRRVAAYDEILMRIRALPGVQAAALTTNLPIEGGTNGGVRVEGKTFPSDQDAVAEKRVVSDGYFETIGARFVAGRSFTHGDAAGAMPAVIINATFARRLLDGATAIGRRVDFNWDTEGFQTVVGVVADIKEQALTESRPAPAIYIPIAQRPISSAFLVVRTSGDPSSLLASIRRAVVSVDPSLPLSNIRTIDTILRTGVSAQRLGMSLLGAFSLVAVVLAAIGLYGVISYSVVQRTQELGVRAALGATRAGIVTLILGQSGGVVAIGLAAGAVLARFGAGLLAAQLFGVTPGSVGIYVVVAATLAVVALAASAVPAARASRIEPLAALRAE